MPQGLHVLMQSMKIDLDDKQSVCRQTLQYLLAIKTEPHALHQQIHASMHALNRALDIRTSLCKHAEGCECCCYKSLPSEAKCGLYNSMDHLSAEQVTTEMSTCTQMVCKAVAWMLPPHQSSASCQSISHRPAGDEPACNRPFCDMSQ